MPNPPKFDPHRGSRGRSPTRLPAAGRAGDTPPWPLLGDASPAERDAWSGLWRVPQAVMWERLGWTRVVARYCRLLVLAEDPSASAAMHAQTTALEDRLGLSPKALRLLLWEIAADEVATTHVTPAASRYAHLREAAGLTDETPSTGSARRRLRVVDPGPAPKRAEG